MLTCHALIGPGWWSSFYVICACVTHSLINGAKLCSWIEHACTILLLTYCHVKVKTMKRLIIIVSLHKCTRILYNHMNCWNTAQCGFLSLQVRIDTSACVGISLGPGWRHVQPQGRVQQDAVLRRGTDSCQIQIRHPKFVLRTKAIKAESCSYKEYLFNRYNIWELLRSYIEFSGARNVLKGRFYMASEQLLWSWFHCARLALFWHLVSCRNLTRQAWRHSTTVTCKLSRVSWLTSIHAQLPNLCKLEFYCGIRPTINVGLWVLTW